MEYMCYYTHVFALILGIWSRLGLGAGLRERGYYGAQWDKWSFVFHSIPFQVLAVVITSYCTVQFCRYDCVVNRLSYEVTCMHKIYLLY